MGELKVRWTTQAADDLEAVFEFIAKDKPSAARRIARKVRDCSRLLARYPRLGRVGNEPATREIMPLRDFLVARTSRRAAVASGRRKCATGG